MSLAVENLTKTFGSKTAVDRLSFNMDSPGVFGLIGTNGAGKTTTIRMILGVMKPDSGGSLWSGKQITRETVRFGYMPEERGIYPKVKVAEQLVYFAKLRGMNGTDALSAAKKWLTRLGVPEYENEISDKLSKGNQQKIQLIAALIHDPELIFLDEPFSGLDPINTEVFKSVVSELCERKKYIVMSSHQMPTVEEYCENLVILNRGKTVLTGNLRSIKAGYGHTNLSVRCAERDEEACAALAQKSGLRLVSHTPEADEFKITGDEMAEGFLSSLIENRLKVEKFEIR